MDDLNDLRLFAAVVGHGGFSAAARALGMPKSRLSKHVARLEAELGVRLLERSTRAVRVTDVGRDVFRQCEAVLAGVAEAEAIAARAGAEPRGTLRVSCPPGLVRHRVAAILPAFLDRHPLLRVRLHVLNRRVDLVEEGFDVALRVRARLDTEPDLMMRNLGAARSVLVAGPSLLRRHAAVSAPADLAGLPSLGMAEDAEADSWSLIGPDGEAVAVAHRPRLCCADFDVLLAAAIAGAGVALLPDMLCRAALRDGALVPVLPGWSAPHGTVHLVFASRRQTLPAVRAFVDHVAAEFPLAERRCSEAQDAGTDADAGGGGASGVAALPDGGDAAISPAVANRFP